MLSDPHLERIRADIERSSLSFQLVKDDLLDHFCCVVESRMEQGESFESAYRAAWQQICPNGLDEIQEETIYLLNASKRAVMKKVMYSIGLIASVSISVGWLFKILNWPGADPLFVYGFLGFVLIFVPMLAIDRYRINIERAISEKLKVILGFSSAFICGLAVLFKIMHLQGADIMLIAGTLLFSFGFLPFLFFGMYKKATE